MKIEDIAVKYLMRNGDGIPFVITQKENYIYIYKGNSKKPTDFEIFTKYGFEDKVIIDNVFILWDDDLIICAEADHKFNIRLRI